MRHIALIYKRGRADAATLAGKLQSWLQERHLEVSCRENPGDSGSAAAAHPDLNISESVDAVVVLGGDGTFLSVARALGDLPTPIVGINLGDLGFLTEISRESCFQDLEDIIRGDFEIEERMRLEAALKRAGKVIFRQAVLNDVVIAKEALARIIDLKTTIDGRYLTTYRADGLIVATPTGSTAYNLSAGGPIVYPTAQAMILSPICSFTLTNRPIILPAHVQVEVEVGPRGEDVVLTCDGQVGHNLVPLDVVVITAARSPVRMLKAPAMDYFEVLRTKMKWGQN